MNKMILKAVKAVCILLTLITTVKAHTSELYLPQSLLESEMNMLAAQLANHKVDENDDNGAFVLQLMDQQLAKAKVSLGEILKSKQNATGWQDTLFFAYDIYLQALLSSQNDHNINFEQAYAQAFKAAYEQLDAKRALQLFSAYNYGLSRGESWINDLLDKLKKQPAISAEDGVELLKRYQPYMVFQKILPLTAKLIEQYQNSRYIIKKNVLIKTKHGVTLSAVVVRTKNMTSPHPTALQFNIYADVKNNVNSAINAANHGYVGIVADTRGKRLSPDDIVPYEHDAKDVNEVIDWISKQPFSDGRVAMYGGSYLGFTQWAATKYMHPALKTIVPSVANNPMQGLPMENNIFITVNIQWPFYVTNNKTMDHIVNNDWNRWQDARDDWYKSGQSYRDFDKVEGTPNPWFQKWLTHPSHDDYWQQMGPYKNEYAKINIPVLSINGYYDDGHISSLDYLKKHMKYNKNAEHYWVIGPYNHFFSQSDWINGYQKDPIAALDRSELAFEWFDYVLKGAKKPDLVKDKVNYQLMGDNSWQHAPSMEALNRKYKRFYLGTVTDGEYYQLSEKPEANQKALSQIVDLADRSTSNNTEYYPWPIIKDKLKDTTGFAFSSAPFEEDTSVHGSFSGELKIKINKRDVDIGLTFYELMADGKLFELSFYIARASYAQDPSRRHLLTPGKIETIPFSNTRMTGKLFKKGSRLVVIANVNKNSNAQVNMGSGKEVSDETVADGKEPLKIEWFNDSFINVPMQAHE